MANLAVRKPATDARLVVTLDMRIPGVKWPNHAVDVLRRFKEEVLDPTDIDELKKNLNQLLGGEIITDISFEVAK